MAHLGSAERARPGQSIAAAAFISGNNRRHKRFGYAADVATRAALVDKDLTQSEIQSRCIAHSTRTMHS